LGNFSPGPSGPGLFYDHLVASPFNPAEPLCLVLSTGNPRTNLRTNPTRQEIGLKKDGFALIEESIPLLWEGTQHVSFSCIAPQDFYANVAILFQQIGF